MRRGLIFFLAMIALASLPLSSAIAGSLPNLENPAMIQAGALDRALTARGLLGARTELASERIHPPAGVEVDETAETTKAGEVISRAESWSETLAGRMLRIELTDYPSRQYQLAFWLMDSDSSGCAIFGRTMYGADGRALKSEFWRNDRELRITGAADFPAVLYPSAVPAIAMTRTLVPMRPGAAGIVSTQITPYGYVDLRVSVSGQEPIAVPAGNFSAYRVDSQADVAKLLPNWPRMLLHLVTPFVPGETYYFDSAPPYRLLKKERAGSAFVGGPEATTELVRYYTSTSADDGGQTAGAIGGARVAQLSAR